MEENRKFRSYLSLIVPSMMRISFDKPKEDGRGRANMERHER